MVPQHASGKNNNYYVNCTTGLPQPAPGQPAPVNQRWNGTGTDPRIWRAIDATEDAQYTVELLPAPGFASCVPNNQYSMVDPNGNMRLRVTGRSRGETRSVIATLRRRNFIDFIYFTDFETLDPAAYSNPAQMDITLRALPRPARGPWLHRDPLRRQRRRLRARSIRTTTCWSAARRRSAAPSAT